MSGLGHDDYDNEVIMDEDRAPTSSLRPFRPALGPSGLLDFVLCALRALRPCDPSKGAMIGQCVSRWIVCLIAMGSFGDTDRQAYSRVTIEVYCPSGAQLLGGGPSGLLDFVLCPLGRSGRVTHATVRSLDSVSLLIVY